MIPFLFFLWMFFICLASSLSWDCRHTLIYCCSLDCTLQIIFFFYKLKICDSLLLSRSAAGAIFSTAFVHFVSLCKILVILPIFQTFFFKSLLNLLYYCFCYVFCFFDHKAYGILVPQPRIKPAPLALEGEVLTTEPPERSQTFSFLLYLLWWSVVSDLCCFSCNFGGAMSCTHIRLWT